MFVGAGGLDAACACVGPQHPGGELGSDGQPSGAELLAPGTTTPGEVSESMGSMSSGGRQGRFGKDHTARRPGLLAFPPASSACHCWEWCLGLDGPLASSGRAVLALLIALDHLHIDLPYL